MLKDITTADIASDAIVTAKLNEERQRLLTRIKRAIRRKTNGGVQKLTVQHQGEIILLRGSCISFYCKQVAQATAMGILTDGEKVQNEIEVSPLPH